MSCCTTGTYERSTSRDAAQGCDCPALDVVETNEAYRVVVEVPGAGKDDVDLQVEKGVLSIRARVPAAGGAPERYHVREHGPRELRRELRLGKTIDADRITAEVSRGLLTLLLPKVAAATPRRIEVR
ncbi:MAG: Hsp20/alpha crystallin family protein [bacterium]